ncbi:hypothetical protein VTK26DRAFT_9300 [Humicola hyalothermophila]
MRAWEMSRKGYPRQSYLLTDKVSWIGSRVIKTHMDQITQGSRSRRHLCKKAGCASNPRSSTSKVPIIPRLQHDNFRSNV